MDEVVATATDVEVASEVDSTGEHIYLAVYYPDRESNDEGPMVIVDLTLDDAVEVVDALRNARYDIIAKRVSNGRFIK